MTSFLSYLRSSIGKKAIMGATGLALSFFVLTHMIGNMLIFVSPEAYNSYGNALTSSHLIYLAEAGLLAAVVLHVIFAFQLTVENKKARPIGYARSPKGDKAASLSSKTMIYSGSILLVFIVLHLATFKFGQVYKVTYAGVEMRDLARLMVEVFQQPGYVAWYIVSLILLGVHLSHGFYSSFQSIGFNHPRYTPWIKCLAWIYALVVSAGFISQPIYVYLHG